MNRDTLNRRFSRRGLLKCFGLATASMLVPGWIPAAARDSTTGNMRTRPIPSTGERIPIVGLGTSDQFDRVPSGQSREDLMTVLKLFFRRGGTLIDTAPVYGRAEEVLGTMMQELGLLDPSFMATKVRARTQAEGKKQIERSFQLLKVGTIDLLQVHSLIGWETQLPLLREYKQRGRVRYIGVTHHAAYAVDELASVVQKEPLDFVQCGYSIDMRDAEDRLLPLAKKKGVAVMVNRPFADGALFQRTRGQSLPPWAADFDCTSWAQFFLKFVLSHPAVTCTIPATSNPDHLVDNMKAGMGALPTMEQRKRMVRHWNQL